MRTICVFAGAANGMSPQFSKEAFRIGQMIGASTAVDYTFNQNQECYEVTMESIS